MSPRYLIALLALALLGGCHGGMSDVTIANGTITLRHNEVRLHVSGAPDASIAANGDLKIDGQMVPIDPAARATLQHYHQAVSDVREHGIATGKAGIAIAGQAVSSVVKGLASGDTDNIDKEVDAKTRKVEQEAMKICGDLVNIKTAQDNLATRLPAFKPYGAIIDAHEITDCRDDSNH